MSIESAGRLTAQLTAPGFWLNPLTCWTAQFSGCGGGRPVLLLSKYVEASLELLQTTYKIC